MDTQDMFRVFDACRPSVPQVLEYLERISGHSPFDLIFSKDGKETITNQISRDLGELIGIVINRTVFYAKGLGRKDVISKENDITVNDLFEFAKTLHSKARPMNKKALEILNKNSENYEKVFNSLKVFGYSALPLQDRYQVFEKPCNEDCVHTLNISGGCVGFTRISSFAYFQNIFFCASCE